MESVIANSFLYSCLEEKKRGSEQFVNETAFGYMVSGETHFYTSEGLVVGKEGSCGIVRRNQLIKSLKVPPAQGEYKAVNVILNQSFLRKYASENNIKIEKHYTGKTLLDIIPNAFIKGYFYSLLPYFEQPGHMTEALVNLKTREAIELLLKYYPQLQEFLFDFEDPAKIDLEAYMNKNYTYNVTLSQFAKLTGRSLSTFKRDFQKLFQDTPENWLRNKRLEYAHYLISKKQQKVSNVYIDAGFENLSHFSTAFKKFYGYPPSQISR